MGILIVKIKLLLTILRFEDQRLARKQKRLIPGDEPLYFPRPVARSLEDLVQRFSQLLTGLEFSNGLSSDLDRLTRAWVTTITSWAISR